MNWNIDTPEGMKNAQEWQQKTLDNIRPGGCWIVPRSFTFITIDHARKLATFSPSVRGEPVIARVLLAMGWSIAEANQNTPTPE